SASQFVQGSVLWNRSDGRLTYAPGPSLQRAGLTGRVFLDENGDGRWEAGEPVVPGVRVLVGTSSASSDSSGWFRVWDLVPFEPVLVTVDSLSIDSRTGSKGTRSQDRKSTRLNSSHRTISYAVFCLKKKKKHKTPL